MVDYDKLTWINEPPIVPIDQSDVQAFLRSIDGAKVGGDGYVAWDASVASAYAVASDMNKSLPGWSKIKRFGYRVDGMLLGAVELEVKSNHVFIYFIAAHPQAVNAGDVLIEYALNLHSSGVIKLSASGGSAGRYEKLDFKFVSGRVFAPQSEADDRTTQYQGEMTLDANESDHWTKPGGGKWKRAKYVESDSKYLGTS